LMKQILAPTAAARKVIASLPPQMQAMAQAAIASGVPPESIMPSEPETPSERMLAMAQIRGQIKTQSLEKVGQMVKANPTDSTGVIRTWIHEAA
jgi:flagellar M-ring protein FliF